MVGGAMGPEQLWRHLLGSLHEQCRDDTIVTALRRLLEREQLDTYALSAFFGEADARGQSVVFLLDEFDQVTTNPNFGPDFYLGFRSLAIRHKVALVTSSRLELVELCHDPLVKSSPFFNIFATVNLRMFSEAEFQSLVSQSLRPTDVRFTDHEAWRVLDLAGRHPYFLQMACYQLFEGYRQDLDQAAREYFLAARFQVEAAPHFGYQ